MSPQSPKPPPLRSVSRGDRAPRPLTALPARGRGPRTAFVLAGGASLGALQVGMLRALYEQGIQADLLVGTSAGALNAAYVASRPQTVRTAQELARVWRGIHRHDIFPIHPPTLIAGLGRHRNHLVPDRPFRQLIARHLGIKRLEQAVTPVHIVTFDLLAGQEVRLSEGPALEAVLAAAAVPGVLPPVRLGEHLLVDGGVVNNTPISHAIALGAERIYVLSTGDPADLALPRAPQGALDAVIHAFTLLVGSRLQADLARYDGAAELIVLPAANPARVQPTDFGQAHRLIASAHAAARAAISNGSVPRAAAA
jgi:NTE family protein